MYMMQRMRLSNLGQCMTLQKQKPRLKRKQRKRIVDRLNGNAQCMKIWHSCIMGNVVLIYLLSMGDYNYEPIGMMNVMKIVLHFLIPSFALHRFSLKHTNHRTEPKHIVFLSHLLLLFKFCRICKADNPTVETTEIGTEAVVTSTCSNPKCPNPKTTGHSQPTMPGTKLPAGNFLLCMAILVHVAGASASKVFTVFAHMGLGCLSLNTFFKYQRVSSHENIVQHNKGTFIKFPCPQYSTMFFAHYAYTIYIQD